HAAQRGRLLRRRRPRDLRWPRVDRDPDDRPHDRETEWVSVPDRGQHVSRLRGVRVDARRAVALVRNHRAVAGGVGVSDETYAAMLTRSSSVSLATTD